ncbi:MAG: hypothetical protein LBN21_12985 [Treponema sp.]|nr:hypothetical protein [Treponema sp.]
MNIADRPAANKARSKPRRLKPTSREGLFIQYKLRDSDESFVGISTRLGIASPSVRYVVFGQRHSARVEAEIARILGKPNWNEVVLEARSAVTGKSKEAVIEEMENRIRERNQASAEALARRIEDAISGKNRPGKKPPTMRRAG